MLSLLAALDPDIIAVIVLAAVIVVVFLLSQINLLPRRSVSYVAAAVLGMVGVGIFNRWKMNKYMAEYEAAKADAARTKKELDDLSNKYKLAQADRDRIIALHQARIDAIKREMALSDAKFSERQRVVDTMNEEELEAEIRAIRERRRLK